MDEGTFFPLLGVFGESCNACEVVWHMTVMRLTQHAYAHPESNIQFSDTLRIYARILLVPVRT